ncbi:MAG: ORF6N domain-containing protein [Campylobacterales bacterium]|nr:ORF6N domain-containing protein [Campylobacterales bacterium]
MEVILQDKVQTKIYTIRGLKVMMDRDLADLYGVETKVFNQAVKRNIKRFPEDFMFQLTKEELENWRSQFVTSNKEKMGIRRQPYAFTEQGISMLSAILKSAIAIDVSIGIMRAFVEM